MKRILPRPRGAPNAQAFIRAAPPAIRGTPDEEHQTRPKAVAGLRRRQRPALAKHMVVGMRKPGLTVAQRYADTPTAPMLQRAFSVVRSSQLAGRVASGWNRAAGGARTNKVRAGGYSPQALRHVAALGHGKLPFFDNGRATGATSWSRSATTAAARRSTGRADSGVIIPRHAWRSFRSCRGLCRATGLMRHCRPDRRRGMGRHHPSRGGFSWR